MAVATSTMVVASCSATEQRLIILGNDVADGASPAFVETADSGPDARGLIEYCPSDKCPSGHVTCPNSRFPCDVDLRSDRSNCGGCGLACPFDAEGRELYECVDGRCVMSCNTSWGVLDCDGLPDNGCETETDSDNCGACGNKCTDPAKPCMLRDGLQDVGCGCRDGQIACGSWFPQCFDPEIDDKNCGGCDNACDPTGGGAPVLANAYYGCNEGNCGTLKCKTFFGNCDGIPENGCEASLFSKQHCGACGNACPGEQECRANSNGFPQCMCGDGLTFCSAGCTNGVCSGTCADLKSDVDNCGSCGHLCTKGAATMSIGVCTNGSCGVRCAQGRADCNGNTDDDCEVNTDSDPRNCGGCGKACDAIAGQACVRGQCVVEPCEGSGGEGPVAR